MPGRGIDQVLLHPGDPRLHEPYVRDARRYVDLAEAKNGAIAKPVSFPYIWGEALSFLEREDPQVRIINLETSITTSDDYWRGKGINYRMNPANIPVLTTAGIDIAVLANNHVLDWGYAGLAETLQALKGAGIRCAGAGSDLGEAEAAAVVMAKKGRVLVFSFGLPSSGIPASWGATGTMAGVNLLSDLSENTLERIGTLVRRVKQPLDIVVASLHWGANWGYGIQREEREFAHRLVDEAKADVVHGHSSHHAKGVEVYGGKPIFYGCGDFVNDYEGIGGYEEFRGDLSLMYFVRLELASGRLVSVRMVPMQMRRFQLQRASGADARWLAETLNREGKLLGTGIELAGDATLNLRW